MKKLILILAVVLPFWANAQDYRVIDWKTDVLNVQTIAIDTFIFDAEPTDYNDAGAITREIGNYFIDFVARCFKIIDSDATTITVVDLEHINLAPQSNKIGRVYQSVVDADSLFESIGGVDISVLDDLSKWKDVARNNEIFGRKIKEKKLVDLSDVNDSTPKLTTTGQTLIWDEDSGYFDFNYNPLSIHEITHEPTGFEYPESVIVNYNSTNRTVTLTGNTTAFWRGDTISALVTGWTSAAHTATAGIWYLYYNGTNFIWSQSPWTFDMVQIAFVNYNFFAIKETHGLMQYQTHKELHETIGTYVSAGGDLSDYVVNSTTAANRRPLISQTTVMDEDNGTVMPALSSETYTRFYLTSIDSAKFTTSSADIVSLSTNQPYWNQLSGGNWQQTLMANNSYSAVWVVGIPATSEAQSQAYRYLFVQPQSNSTTLSTIQAQSASSVSLGQLTGLTPELVFFAKVIIQYTAANWKIVSVEKLIGNKMNQQSIIGGSYLSTVTTDTTLTGNGTTSNPLRVVGAGFAKIYSGTKNYIPKITGADSLGNSTIVDNGSTVSTALPFSSNTSLSAPTHFAGGSFFNSTSIEIGAGRTGNNFAFIDFVGDQTYTDYGLRIFRNNSGADAFSAFYHRGKGDLAFVSQDAAKIIFNTKGITGLTIDTLQNSGFGTTTPAARIHSQSTTTQLRLGYDATKYTDLSTGSTGNLTIDPTGDTTKVVGAVNSTGGFFKNGVEITGGSMVYPPSGIAKSTGTGWATSIVDNSSNWNTPYTPFPELDPPYIP